MKQYLIYVTIIKKSVKLKKVVAMYKIIKFDKEERYINDFLSLPSKIYDKRTITQNIKDETKILNGTHSLSKYFKLLKLTL